MIKITEKVTLAPYTTLRVGGRARYFTIVRSIEELKEAILLSKRHHLAVFILGEGSNVVISDKGFDGLVVKIDIRGVHFTEVDDNATYVTAGAGENWDALVERVIGKNLYGMENLSFIPGTVGATPIQNVGAYGVEAKDIITEVSVFDTESLTSRTLLHSDCTFSYRDSIFKKKKNFIVTSVTYRLRKGYHTTRTYKDVAEELQRRGLSRPTLLQVRSIIGAIRSRKFPSTRDVGTAGSFFKNLILTSSECRALKESYPTLPSFEMEDENVKVPLAWLLDYEGWKGYQRGSVGTFRNQPLVLVNFGGATASELKQLSDDVASHMKKKNIAIIPEVTFVGEFE